MILEIESKTHGSFKSQYDDEDEALIKKYTWCIQKMSNGKFYVVTNIKGPDGKQKTKSLHQLIMNTPKGMDTDHIDGDPLNNRRKNLRKCTRSENMRNRGKTKSNTSGFVGVYAVGNRWQAMINYEGKNKYLGTFDTRSEAGRARDRATVKLRNLITPRMLNFPGELGFDKS